MSDNLWEKVIVDSSFSVIGTCRTGKTCSVMATAWLKSNCPRKIAVFRESDRGVSAGWDCTARLPFTEKGIDRLERILCSKYEYSVLMEFEEFSREKSSMDLRPERVKAAWGLSNLLTLPTDPVRLLLDNYESYGCAALSYIDQVNPMIVAGYAFQSVSQLENYEIDLPSVDAQMFLHINDNATIDFAAEVLGGKEMAAWLKEYPARYALALGEMVSSGSLLPRNSDGKQ